MKKRQRTPHRKQDDSAVPNSNRLQSKAPQTGSTNKKSELNLLHLERLWEGDEPDPLQYIVEDLVPEGFVSIVYGHSGLGKSYVVLRMAMSILTGADFQGKATNKQNILWLDFELNRDEMKRRAFRTARGMGLQRPPNGLHYHKAKKPLGSSELSRRLRATIKKHGIGVVLIDSLSLGSIGSDMSSQVDTVAVMKELETWGTCICIDHVAKSGAENQAKSTIFGSTFKRAIARSSVRLMRADSDALTLQQEKANFGQISAPIHFRMQFQKEGAVVAFVSLQPDDPLLAESYDLYGAAGKTLAALHNLTTKDQPRVSLSELAKEIGRSPGTVRNHLKEIEALIVRHGDSTYSLRTIHDSLENVNHESEPDDNLDSPAEELDGA